LLLFRFADFCSEGEGEKRSMLFPEYPVQLLRYQRDFAILPWSTIIFEVSPISGK
jgi:hypothetical protein